MHEWTGYPNMHQPIFLEPSSLYFAAAGPWQQRNPPRPHDTPGTHCSAGYGGPSAKERPGLFADVRLGSQSGDGLGMGYALLAFSGNEKKRRETIVTCVSGIFW